MVKEAQAGVEEALKPPNVTTQLPPIKKAVPEDKSVVVMEQGDPEGIRAAEKAVQLAESFGWTAKTVAFKTTEIGALNGIYTNIANMSPKPDAVLSYAVSAKLYPQGLKALKDAEVPLIISGTGDPIGDGIAVSLFGEEQYGEGLGQPIGDWMIADSGGKANAAIFNIPIYPSVNGSAEYVKNQLEECAECEVDVVNESSTQIAQGEQGSVVVNYVRSHPEVEYVYPIYLGASPAIAKELRAAGVSEKVKLVGGTPSPNLWAELKEGGPPSAAGAFDSQVIAFSWIDAAARLLAGESTKPSEDLPVPGQLFDESNASEITWSEHWEAKGLEAQFEELWGH